MKLLFDLKKVFIERLVQILLTILLTSFGTITYGVIDYFEKDDELNGYRQAVDYLIQDNVNLQEMRTSDSNSSIRKNTIIKSLEHTNGQYIIIMECR